MVATQPKYWTYDDLFDLPEGRYEIVDGELYQMPAPGMDHAHAVINLIPLLLPIVYAMGGEVFTAPVDVFMRGANPVQPDIIVLLAEKLGLESDRGIEGAPDLLVEIISPSNPERDIKLKWRHYALAGVREYWLVHPQEQWFEVMTLRGDEYVTHVRATGDEVVSSPLLLGLSFPAAAAFVRRRAIG
jgi:Uma2 family endonuclease